MNKVGLSSAVAVVLAVAGSAALPGCAGRAAHFQDSERLKEHSHDEDPWNRGRPPDDWWAAIERMHGHVGPWNVLGWRIGQAALREFDTEWGRHELDIICYVPMRTPYTCMADGLVMGTGNCLGRLDIRLAEVVSMELIHVAVRRKDGTSAILIFRPKVGYLKLIQKPKAGELERLSHMCKRMKEAELFRIERIHPSSAGN